MKSIDVFLSYCWSDKDIADEIYDNLVNHQSNISIHRDVADIQQWGNIKKFMQSIEKMDYTILLISDAYLKSRNCMYEVLEVMKDSAYDNKIFPVIIFNGIYQPSIRVQYVRYWQNEYEQFQTALEGINKQNLGSLTEDLKHLQNIAANVADFLSKVSELNNPAIKDISEAILNKLRANKLIGSEIPEKAPLNGSDMEYFKDLYTAKSSNNVTDLEIINYMVNSFDEINKLFCELCKKYEENNKNFNILDEKINSRNYIYNFFQNGISKRTIKIFINDSFGGLTICVSENSSYISTSTSWNEMYSPKVIDGKIKLVSMMNVDGNSALDVIETVKNIWKRFVAPYL